MLSATLAYPLPKTDPAIGPTPAPVISDTMTPKDWVRIISAYQKPSLQQCLIELGTTFSFLALFWMLSWQISAINPWLGSIFLIPTALFLVRLFVIQHDCGHQAFFKTRALNDWVGRTLGIFTLTPYYVWRRAHALHHAGSGNLNRRDIGEIITITVAEYQARSWLGRLRYRLYRHPMVILVLGPAYLYFFQQRLPVGFMTGHGWRPWISALGTNAAIAVLFCTMGSLVGFGTFALIHAPVVWLAASFGVFLFFVQHQFEDTYWAQSDDWEFAEAALKGSTYFALPPWLQWMTGYIGIHHVHHLCAKVPFYRLPQVLKDHPQLTRIGRLTLFDAVCCLRLHLWDEEKRKLVAFNDIRQRN